MADEADYGNDIMEESLSRTIANISNQVRHAVESEEFCIDCDDPIPEARRQAIKGCQRCVTCQENLDKRAKHFVHH